MNCNGEVYDAVKLDHKGMVLSHEVKLYITKLICDECASEMKYIAGYVKGHSYQRHQCTSRTCGKVVYTERVHPYFQIINFTGGEIETYDLGGDIGRANVRHANPQEGE